MKHGTNYKQPINGGKLCRGYRTGINSWSPCPHHTILTATTSMKYHNRLLLSCCQCHPLTRQWERTTTPKTFSEVLAGHMHYRRRPNLGWKEAKTIATVVLEQDNCHWCSHPVCSLKASYYTSLNLSTRSNSTIFPNVTTLTASSIPITYTVVNIPSTIMLYVNGSSLQVGSQFTQDDVNNRAVNVYAGNVSGTYQLAYNASYQICSLVNQTLTINITVPIATGVPANVTPSSATPSQISIYIGVSLGVVAFLTTCLGIFWLWRRRQRHRLPNTNAKNIQLESGIAHTRWETLQSSTSHYLSCLTSKNTFSAGFWQLFNLSMFSHGGL